MRLFQPKSQVADDLKFMPKLPADICRAGICGAGPKGKCYEDHATLQFNPTRIPLPYSRAILYARGGQWTYQKREPCLCSKDSVQ